MPVTSPARDWPQLDAFALGLLRAELARPGASCQSVARRLGVSRSAVSQARDLRYPGDARRLRARIVETFAGQIDCPHLGRQLAPAECRQLRERPLSECCASRAEVQLWQACQACPFNPDRKEPAPC